MNPVVWERLDLHNWAVSNTDGGLSLQLSLQIWCLGNSAKYNTVIRFKGEDLLDECDMKLSPGYFLWYLKEPPLQAEKEGEKGRVVVDQEM